MSARATGTFRARSWNEAPFNEIEGGPRLTRGRIVNDYKGGLDGEGTLEYLMIYNMDAPATFLAVERIVGRVGMKSGSFVVTRQGTYDPKSGVSGTLSVVPGSGTGALAGLNGSGSVTANAGENGGTYTLEYDSRPTPKATRVTG